MKKINKKKLTSIIIITICIIIVFLIIFLLSNYTENKYTNTVTNTYETGGSGRGSTTGTRITYNFNYDWKFSKGVGTLDNMSSNTVTDPCEVDGVITYIPNPVEGVSDEKDIPYNLAYQEDNYTSCMNNTWKNVSLPHTYNDEDTFNNFMETEQNGERSMYAGTAWYKKEFNLDISYASGKKIIVEFEAARQAAKVWINGHLLDGVYQNGFIAFGYELPIEYLNFGTGDDNKNIITVMTDNSFPYYALINGVKTNSMLSWHNSHWQPNYGGLYRNSYLYVVDDLHLTIPLYSFTEGVGTYIYTNNETNNSAHLHIDAEVENSSNTSKTFFYRAIIKNMIGETVLTLNGEEGITLPAGEKQILNLEGVLSNVIWWSTAYPYLYTCEVELYDSNNDIIDNNLNTFGVRTFRFTTDSGFYLNEHSLVLDGWGQKSTWEWAAVGAAYPDWMSEYGIKQIKDAGGNYLRFGHTAGSATQINMADKYGILVTQPGVDGEGTSETGVYDVNSYQVRIEAMRDLVVYFRNHPSIILWELGNQATGIGNNFGSGYTTRFPWLTYDAELYSPDNYASILYATINQFDYGNRLNVSTNKSYGTWAQSQGTSNRLVTIRQTNDYTTTPYIEVSETTEGGSGGSDRPFVEGEHTRLEIRRGMYDRYTTGFTTFHQTSSNGANYTDATGETVAIQQVANKKNALTITSNVGGANWIFSDTISHGRVQSEVARTTGEVDAVMLPKSSYYVNQVLNSDSEPAIYLLGHWNYPAGTTKPIYVVAKNVNSVSLFIDGTLIGTQTKQAGNQDNYLYTFNDVSYSGNYIEAIGYDGSDNEIVSYRVSKHGEVDHLEITAVNGPTGVIANGSDILILDVKALDANNNVCISYDGEVQEKLVNFTYNLTDNGKITGEFLGGYNSGVPINTRTDNLYLEAGITRVFVRTTKNAGSISVTASMDGVTSDTYQTTSNSFTQTNGLTTSINPTATYNLDNTLYEGLGVGAKLGTLIEAPSTSMVLIENLGYRGSDNASNGINDAMQIGSRIYSDNAALIATMPYKFYNSELITIPNGDRDLTEPDLLTFNVTRNVTIFIARDPSLSIPSWFTTEGYVRSTDPVTGENDTITSTTGAVYDVYKKEVTVDIQNWETIPVTITIGGNTNNGSDAIAANGQFIFVKKTINVNDRTFFHQDFNYFTESSIMNGWNGFKPNTTRDECISVDGTWDNTNYICSNNDLTTLTRASIAGHTGIRLTDNKSTSLAYISKEFGAIDQPFTVSFKAYVGSNKVNQWLRTFISLEKPQSITDKSNVPVEVYLFRKERSNVLALKYKDNKGASKELSLTNVLTDTWYTYVYYVDPIAKKWQIKVYNDTGDTLISTTNTMNFSVTSYTSFDGTGTTIPLNKLNYITFGTGQNVLYTTDFYIDDVIVKPVMDLGATSFTVDGHVINITSDITSYALINSTAPSESVVSATTTNDYYNHTLTRNDDNDTLTVDLENLNGEHFIFDVVYERNSALEGWNIVPEDQALNPNTTASSIIKDNRISIHLNDTANDKEVYIYKQVPSLSSAINFSFDFNLTNDVSFSQDLLSIYLSNGEMTNINDFAKLGVRSHLIASNLNSYLSVIEKNVSTDTTTTDDTIITKNTWHTLRYYINVSTDTYSVFLDDVEILSDIEFYNEQTSIDHIYIGTNSAETGDLYISNVSYQEESGYPIDGISIDQSFLPNFDPASDTYDFYSDERLTNDTTITLSETVFYVFEGTTVTKNIEEQTITIIAMDNFGNTHSYTINYKSLVNRPIDTTELQALVDEANTFIQSNYTYNTWDILQQKISAANYAIENADILIEQDLGIAYYELETAMNNMLMLFTYNGYETATIQTINYSSNLQENNEDLFSFEKVLDNDKPVYFNSDITFTSVPYRYMNSEYLVLTNRTYKNGLITLQPLQRIDILIFKDRDAGPLTVEGFSYTGEIATSSTGVVYKIYSKTYGDSSSTEFDPINLEFNDLVNNEITSNANIIAFINHAKSDNETFINENFDIYDESLFNKAWFSKASVNIDYPNSNTFNGIVGGVDNSIQLVSNSVQVTTATYGWSMVYKEMAKLKEQIIFKFDFNLPTITPNTINRYSRAWLRQGPGNIKATLTTTPTVQTNNTNTGDKAYGLIDLYVHVNNGTAMNIMANSITTGGSIQMTQQGGVSVGNWASVEVRMNILTKKFQVVYDGKTWPSTTTYYSMINTSPAGQNGYNGNITYADYVYFASRLQGPTNIKYKDIVVYPVASNLYEDIQVNNTSIGNYTDLTKVYLYQVADQTEFLSATALPITGTMVDTDDLGDDLLDNDSIVINPMIDTITNGSEKVTSIDETYISTSLGTYVRNYKVYYEVNSDNATVNGTYGKDDLVDKLKEAMEINPLYYSITTFAPVTVAINNAIDVLANHNAIIGDASSTSLSEVTGAYKALANALDGLNTTANAEFDYQGKMTTGDAYNDFNNTDVNITNKSSFTANFKLESRITGNYMYEDMEHSKYIETDTTLYPGTKITLIDKCGIQDEYYYYIVTQGDYDEDKIKYSLEDFIKMNTLDSNFVSNYNLVGNILTEEYQIIVDFENTNTIPTGEHTITLQLYVTDNTQNPAVTTQISSSSILNYKIYNDLSIASLEITPDNTIYAERDTVILSSAMILDDPVVDGVTVTDTLMDNKRISSRISVYTSTYNAESDSYIMGDRISFPKGTTLTEDNIVHYLSSDGYLRTSEIAGNENNDRTFIITPGYYGFDVGHYYIKTELIATYDSFNEVADYSEPVIATYILDIEVVAIPNCAIHATLNETQEVFTTGNPFRLNVTIDSVCNYTTSDQKITLSLYKKTLPGHLDFGYTQINYQDYVNNSITTLYNNTPNLYLLHTYPYEFSTRMEKTYPYSVHFNNSLPAGMYKLEFDVRNGNVSQTDFITFVVK